MSRACHTTDWHSLPAYFYLPTTCGENTGTIPDEKRPTHNPLTYILLVHFARQLPILWSSYKLKRGNIWFRQTDFAKPCIGLNWRNVSKIKNGLPCVYEIPRRVYPLSGMTQLSCRTQHKRSEKYPFHSPHGAMSFWMERSEMKNLPQRECIARDLSPVFDTTNIWPLSSNRRPRKKSMHRPYKAKRGYQRQHNDTPFFFYLTTSLLS